MPNPDVEFALPLAARLGQVAPSATSTLFREVASRRARGERVLGLHVGEPDFDTPAHVVEAAQRALAEGATRYTPVSGLPVLREAICADSRSRRAGHAHGVHEVVVSSGAKQSLFNAVHALFGPGDEVIVPAPGWVSYPDQLRLAGATPVIVQCPGDGGFKLTPAALEAALTPASRGLILCTPNNPTGTTYSAAELRALADVVAARNLWVIVDEIYSELVYGGRSAASWLEVAPEQRGRTVIIDGVSKRFAMTGFRIGWCLAPAEVATACETLQSQSTTSAASVCQHAALAALTGPQAPVAAMVEAFQRRRDAVMRAIAAIPDVSCVQPDGAFYAFLDVSQVLARPDAADAGGATDAVADDTALAERLLRDQQLALVPGSAFMTPGHLRLAYAVADDVLAEGLERLGAGLAAS